MLGLKNFLMRQPEIVKAGSGVGKLITKAEVMEAIQAFADQIAASLVAKFEPLLKNIQASEQADAVHHLQRTQRCSKGNRRFQFPFDCEIFFKPVEVSMTYSRVRIFSSMNVLPRPLLCWITKPLVLSFASQYSCFALSSFVSIPSWQHVSLRGADPLREVENQKVFSNCGSSEVVRSQSCSLEKHSFFILICIGLADVVLFSRILLLASILEKSS